jgi:hypothetical protein
MAITRQQSKKMNLKTAPAPTPTPTTNPSIKHKHGIDFIEASKEWRKNKVKLDNGTFDYILL